MPFVKTIAKQLRKPSGIIGRFVIARMLNRRNVPLNLLTLQCLDLQPDDRVLEVGFGGGELISRLAGIVTAGSMAGVDFSPAMVALCARRFATLIAHRRLELYCASAESLPLPANQFTKACTVNTIYFWSDPRGPLNEIHRVLRAGGRLALGFNPPQTLRKVPYTKYGFSFHEPAQVEALLAEAGFRDIRMVRGAGLIGEFICAVAIK
jgi:arsenite methyltransferase